MTSLLAVFALRNARIHIYSSNCSNMLFYIKTSINKAF